MTTMIIVSKDVFFLNAIRTNFTMTQQIEQMISIGKMEDIQSKLYTNKHHCVIVDMDSFPIMNDVTRLLLDRFQVQFIFVASDYAKERQLPKHPKVSFIYRSRNAQNSSSYLALIKAKLLHTQQTGAVTPVKRTPMPFGLGVSAEQTIICIASSTGGTEALEKILKELPADLPPMMIVQHMPTGFTKLFADRLNSFCALEVREAKDHEPLAKGLVLIAPADYHMKLVKERNQLVVQCFKGVKVNGVMPAADILFESVADVSKEKAIGVILTGMGADGARGLSMMRRNGAQTIGQDQKTCIVYGMPKAAFELGAVQYQLPLDDIGAKIVQLAKDKERVNL